MVFSRICQGHFNIIFKCRNIRVFPHRISMWGFVSSSFQRRNLSIFDSDSWMQIEFFFHKTQPILQLRNFASVKFFSGETATPLLLLPVMSIPYRVHIFHVSESNGKFVKNSQLVQYWNIRSNHTIHLNWTTRITNERRRMEKQIPLKGIPIYHVSVISILKFNTNDRWTIEYWFILSL